VKYSKKNIFSRMFKIPVIKFEDQHLTSICRADHLSTIASEFGALKSNLTCPYKLYQFLKKSNCIF